MTEKEFNKITPGVYTVTWLDTRKATAMIGACENGDRWIQCVAWESAIACRGKDVAHLIAKIEPYTDKPIGVGDKVEFKGEDSEYTGTIVCIFKKLNGTAERIVVEDDRGLLLIKNPKHAKKVNV